MRSKQSLDKEKHDKKGLITAKIDSMIILGLAFISGAIITHQTRTFISFVLASVAYGLIYTFLYSRGLSFGKKWGDNKELSGDK
jgi:hypothetical protein